MKNGTMKQLAFEIMLEQAWLVTERSLILLHFRPAVHLIA